MQGLQSFNILDFSAFQSDGARIVAVLIIAVALVAIAAVKPISSAWVEDRKDRRKYEQQNRRLQEKISAHKNAPRERK
jgi:hypothetical protein